MKTMILINTPFGLESNIAEIKQRIVEYVGSRLVRYNPDNAPLIELHGVIENVDKEMISKFTEEVLETAALIIVETDDDQFGRNGNMLLVQPV